MKKILLLLFFLSSLQAAEYKIAVQGHSVGKATFDINITENSYQVNYNLFPNILANILGYEDMENISQGSIKDGHYYPKIYKLDTTEGKSLFSVVFSNNTAEKTNKGKTNTVEISPIAQDPLSQIAQISADLEDNKLALMYHLVTENSNYVYSAKSENVASGILVTLVEFPKADYTIRLWFDSEERLLRMQKEKRGKIDFDMIKL